MRQVLCRSHGLWLTLNDQFPVLSCLMWRLHASLLASPTSWPAVTFSHGRYFQQPVHTAGEHIAPWRKMEIITPCDDIRGAREKFAWRLFLTMHDHHKSDALPLNHKKNCSLCTSSQIRVNGSSEHANMSINYRSAYARTFECLNLSTASFKYHEHVDGDCGNSNLVYLVIPQLQQ